MNPTLIAIVIALAVVISARGVIVWLINAMANSRAKAAVAEKDKEAAEHRAAEVVKAEETRNEIARADFNDVIDRM